MNVHFLLFPDGYQLCTHIGEHQHTIEDPNIECTCIEVDENDDLITVDPMRFDYDIQYTYPNKPVVVFWNQAQIDGYNAELAAETQKAIDEGVETAPPEE